MTDRETKLTRLELAILENSQLPVARGVMLLNDEIRELWLVQAALVELLLDDEVPASVRRKAIAAIAQLTKDEVG